MKPHQLDDIRRDMHALFATFDLRITVVTEKILGRHLGPGKGEFQTIQEGKRQPPCM